MSYRPFSGPVPGPNPLLDVETIIRELTQDFCTAFNTGNFDQNASLFAPDGLLMPPKHEAAQGAKSIEKTLQEFADRGFQNLRMETTWVEYSGDMAVEVGRYTVSMRQPNGTPFMDRGKYVNAWRRMGAWRMIAGCWSSDLPATAVVAA